MKSSSHLFAQLVKRKNKVFCFSCRMSFPAVLDLVDLAEVTGRRGVLVL